MGVPGGKRESGETSEQALVRELREELGIEADVGPWLMDVPQRYPDKHLTLEVRHVRSWKGTPRGREGQAITWVAQDKLGRYSMPPTCRWCLRQPDRYLITPRRPKMRTGMNGCSRQWRRASSASSCACRRSIRNGRR